MFSYKGISSSHFRIHVASRIVTLLSSSTSAAGSLISIGINYLRSLDIYDRGFAESRDDADDRRVDQTGAVQIHDHIRRAHEDDAKYRDDDVNDTGYKA